MMKTYEVTGFGFNASSDETDDRVFWVKAPSHEDVSRAIAGTKAACHDTIDAEDSIDFHLPAQAELLRAKLLEFEYDHPEVVQSEQAKGNDLGTIDTEGDYQKGVSQLDDAIDTLIFGLNWKFNEVEKDEILNQLRRIQSVVVNGDIELLEDASHPQRHNETRESACG